MASDEQVAEVLKAAINAQLGTTAQALDHDEHQGRTSRHVQFGCARRFSPTERAGRASAAGFRVSTRAVGATVTDVRELQRRVDLALAGRSLSIEGRRTTPIRRESQDEPAADDKLYSALTVWTFTR